MKFTKPWKAIFPGDQYAQDFFAGQDVPSELRDEAVKAGVADAPKSVQKPTGKGKAFE